MRKVDSLGRRRNEFHEVELADQSLKELIGEEQMEKNRYTGMECNTVIVDATHVIVEPGDCTRYDFIATQVTKDNWTFVNAIDGFAYPSYVNRYDNAEELAERFNCNPCTAQVCLEYIRQQGE